MAVVLPLYVPDVADYLALGLDRIDWERSETLEAGPFYPVRGTLATQAALTGALGAPFDLQGLTLKVLINGISYTATFTDPNPYIISDVVVIVDAAISNAVASDSATKLKITTTGTGTAATLKITNGTANAVLGFTENQHVWGLDAYKALVAGTYTYIDYDLSGVSGYWYRYRFVSSTTGDYTDWLETQQAVDSMEVDLAEVCHCWLKVADLDGTGLNGIEVLITNPQSAENVALSGSGYAIVGTRLTMTTDSRGYAEIYLPRGATIDISIEGTGLVRRLTLPTDQDTVNLLDSAFGDGDLFEVQTFDIPLATRTI